MGIYEKVKDDPILTYSKQGFELDWISDVFYGVLWQDKANYLGFRMDMHDTWLQLSDNELAEHVRIWKAKLTNKPMEVCGNV